MNFNETFRNYLLGVYLEPNNFWSQADSGWLPQLIELNNHKNDYDTVVFTDIELKYSVVVVWAHSYHIL